VDPANRPGDAPFARCDPGVLKKGAFQDLLHGERLMKIHRVTSLKGACRTRLLGGGQAE
jgi:hypothetical protein